MQVTQLSSNFREQVDKQNKGKWCRGPPPEQEGFLIWVNQTAFTKDSFLSLCLLCDCTPYCLLSLSNNRRITIWGKQTFLKLLSVVFKCYSVLFF